MTLLIPDQRGKLGRLLWETHRCGVMAVERLPTLSAPSQPWALDNGAYRSLRRNEGPDFTHFRSLLDRTRRRRREGGWPLPNPLFVVAPDLPGAGPHSLRYSRDELMRLYDAGLAQGLRWALAVSGGSPSLLDRYQGLYSVLFLAGSDAFKREEGQQWCRAAASWGMPVHYARCSSPLHLARAQSYGCRWGDSPSPPGMHTDEGRRPIFCQASSAGLRG